MPPIHQQPRKTTVYGFLLEVTFGDNLLVILVNPFSNPFSNPLVKVGEDLLNVKLKVIPKILSGTCLPLFPNYLLFYQILKF